MVHLLPRSWTGMIALSTFLASYLVASTQGQSASVNGTIPFTVQGETYQTWYTVFGDLTAATATPLVVLHGGPGLSHDYLLPISDLSASRPVIFYDQLGTARSTHLDSKPQSFWTIDLFINELDNLISHFGIQNNFDILGHSWGGILGAEYEVQRHPAGLQHLVLSDSLPAMSLWDQSETQLASAFPEDVQEGLAAGFTNVTQFRAALATFNAVHGCTVKPSPGDLNTSFDFLFNDPTVSLAMNDPLANWTIIDRLNLVSVPTYVINGAADIAQDFVVEPFVQNIPTVQWTTFNASSHTPMWEERENYMTHVGDFLDN